MAKLQIRKVGDEALRKVCRPVDTITPRVLTLLDDMVETMRAANGVGLAAPQVGILRRIAVIEVEPGEVYELISQDSNKYQCFSHMLTSLLVRNSECTGRMLKQASHLNFVGNAEGSDLFTGDVDVVVCDGFVGNVALKLSEGLARSIRHLLKRELTSNGILPRLGAALSMPAFKSFKKIVDYAEYGGAPLLGLKGIAIVCHGKSNEKAICSAMKLANSYIVKGTQQRLVEAISANEELSSYAMSL